jgi:excisionase family DNA binding protein
MTTTNCPAIMVPMGDGTFLIRPNNRLTVSQAAKIAGVSKWSIYRLVACGMIEAVRPTKGRVFIVADSLNAHLAASSDPEFWKKQAAAIK